MRRLGGERDEYGGVRHVHERCQLDPAMPCVRQCGERNAIEWCGGGDVDDCANVDVAPTRGGREPLAEPVECGLVEGCRRIEVASYRRERTEVVDRFGAAIDVDEPELAIRDEVRPDHRVAQS